MEIRYGNSPAETSRMNAAEIRQNFLMQHKFVPGEINLVYTMYDRVIGGGIVPTNAALPLGTYPILKSDHFFDRREMGIINIGGKGSISVDGQTFDLEKLDCLYIGKGSKDVSFSSESASNPAAFYVLSAPAHAEYPTTKMTSAEAQPTDLGDQLTANKRTVYKYIHIEGIQSCQVVMGLTRLAPGNVWNTMPSHVHDRRMELYCYFDVDDNHRVMHFMGEPQETKHMVVANREIIISPPWSIHSGCGTSNYAFVWGMAGENKVYQDMDPVPVETMR
ncbi:MAG: 5-dehydro-4-deoxy-D-glucuronate isomerase [Saprospiraceae bacterium]|nr:5-dehydro-4-deoxy-D-glucuronate isomerase [Saprospiraceae bacterium]